MARTGYAGVSISVTYYKDSFLLVKVNLNAAIEHKVFFESFSVTVIRDNGQRARFLILVQLTAAS